MRLELDGITIDTDVIGGFKINEHEYAVCSYVDSLNNSKIVIVEVIRNGENITTKDIPENEYDYVLATYTNIEEKILEGDDYE